MKRLSYLLAATAFTAVPLHALASDAIVPPSIIEPVLLAPAPGGPEATADAGAMIVAPLRLSNVTAMYFGTVAPSLTADDTVVLGPSGDKTCGSELTCLTDDHTAASFNVTGADNTSYTIDLPSTVNLANGNGVAMTVDGFNGSKESGTLANGADTFDVGGTLNVAANQATGEYTGSFIVTVEYQ